MTYGFSCMGALFVLSILAPSFLFVNLPRYPEFHSHHKWGFSAMDRLGLTASMLLALIFRNSSFHGLQTDLILAWVFLIGYQAHWIYCRRRNRKPVVVWRIPLMLLPALALFFLGLYGRNWFLCLSSLVYGIGHSFGWSENIETPCSCPCCGDGGSCDLQK